MTIRPFGRATRSRRHASSRQQQVLAKVQEVDFQVREVRQVRQVRQVPEVDDDEEKANEPAGETTPARG